MRNKQRIVVTGGSGFIGSHLLQRLQEKGFEEVVSLNTPTCNVFTDTQMLGSIIRADDIVVHLACASKPVSSSGEVELNHGELAERLLETCLKKGVQRFLFTSSGGTVYGEGLDQAHKETDLVRPGSPYAKAKIEMEGYIQSYGLRNTILRIANPYGRKRLQNEQLGAVDVFLRRVLRDQPIVIWGDGNLVRDYIHIDDVVSFFIKAIEEELYGVYNVASGIGTSLNELVSLIESVTGKQAKIEYRPARNVDIHRNILDIAKSRSTGWQATLSLREGIEMLYQYLKSS